MNGDNCIREIVRPRIGDYLVTGVDVRLLDQKLLLRMFGVLDLTSIEITEPDGNDGRKSETHGPFSEEGFGAIIYPEIGYNFGNGLELSGGTLVQLGKDHGKFGDPAAGGSLVWSRARFSF